MHFLSLLLLWKPESQRGPCPRLFIQRPRCTICAESGKAEPTPERKWEALGLMGRHRAQGWKAKFPSPRSATQSSWDSTWGSTHPCTGRPQGLAFALLSLHIMRSLSQLLSKGASDINLWAKQVRQIPPLPLGIMKSSPKVSVAAEKLSLNQPLCPKPCQMPGVPSQSLCWSPAWTVS